VKELVVGADGFIGSKLQQELNCEGTSRKNPLYHQNHYLDLSNFQESDLPRADVVYLCFGVNGSLTCAQNPQESFRINVDSTIKLAKHYSKSSFVVWIGSTTVEWSTDHYARQKLTTETVLRTLPNVSIVRAGRVTKENLDDLIYTLKGLGRNKIPGVKLWGEDEKPYVK